MQGCPLEEMGSEYVRAPRERHNSNHSGKQAYLEIGNVWKIGIVTELIPGRDKIVQAVRLRAGKSFKEGPIQFLYPLKLHCSAANQMQSRKLNAEAREFRPKRNNREAASIFQSKLD